MNVANSAITVILQTRTEFNNQVTVKSILILEGMIGLILIFAIGVFYYLYIKMKNGYQSIIKEKRMKSQKP
jgi:CHASE3 domain sensor protein